MNQMIKSLRYILFILFIHILTNCQKRIENSPPQIDKDPFIQYIKLFNQNDAEDVVNAISNAESQQWLIENIPFLECPDKTIERIYYYRWWTFRKHLKQTPKGYVFTEFITPVSHAGAYNTISCALGHHIMEGRWLHNSRFLNEYIRFWFRGNDNKPQPHFHKFSSWVADAIHKKFLVDLDSSFVLNLLPDLIEDYRLWEVEKQLDNGLFWQFDVRDGMEESISGSRTARNIRPTINSYMVANAKAISSFAFMGKMEDTGRHYLQKAQRLSQLLTDSLWDNDSKFYKVKLESGTISDAREAIGFIPWYFNIPSTEQNFAWEQIIQTDGFKAPKGITTAEQRHPEFRSHGTGTCEWDGAVWPFASSQTLVGMANFIRNYDQHTLVEQDYYNALLAYADSHVKNGKPYIGEYLDEQTGEWLKGDNPRSIFYNHSTFCDLVISGLIGLIPRDDHVIEVNPLVTKDNWPWFALEGVRYHGYELSIFWDETGEKYHKKKGLSVYVDGKLLVHSPALKRVIEPIDSYN